MNHNNIKLRIPSVHCLRFRLFAVIITFWSYNMFLLYAPGATLTIANKRIVIDSLTASQRFIGKCFPVVIRLC